MMAADLKNIVILGGSYGGVSTAHYVLKHAVPALPDSSSYMVNLICPSEEVFCRPACPRALISDDLFPQEKLFVNISKQFEQYPKGSFRFVHGKATGLDHANRVVTYSSSSSPSTTAETSQLEYHALVIATGTSAVSPLLGVQRDVPALRASWVALREALPTAKSIVIVGGGPSGVEVAGELGDHLNGRPGWFASQPANPKAAITLVTAGPRILPGLRPALAEKAETLLAKLGVKVVKNTHVASVSPAGAGKGDEVAVKAAVTLDDGATLDADLYIPATGTKANTDFVDDSLKNAETGHLTNNPETLRLEAAGPRVYVVGDVATMQKSGIHNILSQIPILGANIKRDLLLAAGADKAFIQDDRLFKEDTSETQLVPIGKSWGVGAGNGWQMPSFMVWLIKGRDYWLWAVSGLWNGKQWAKEK